MYVYLSSLFVLGLIVGSFISALTYRLPRGIQFLVGRSFCDNCKTSISWYLNIPLISYIFLRGKSGCCKTQISLRYPTIELTTALLFVFLYLLGFSLIYFVLALVLLTIVIIDYEKQIIPDELSFSLLFLGLFMNPSLIGLLLGLLSASFLLFIHLLTKGKGMGLGDVKLAIGLGLLLGTFEEVFLWMNLSFILGGLYSFFLLIFQKANLKTKLAFGPFLIIAFVLIYFFDIVKVEWIF